MSENSSEHDQGHDRKLNPEEEVKKSSSSSDVGSGHPHGQGRGHRNSRVHSHGHVKDHGHSKDHGHAKDQGHDPDAVHSPPDPDQDPDPVHDTDEGHIHEHHGNDEELEESRISLKPEGITTVGKPQVWIRLRPTDNFDSNVFEIGEDKKTVKLLVYPEDRLFQKKTGKVSSFNFPTDGVLQETSQEDTFKYSVEEIVVKAMQGIPGVVICVGPEDSGKSHTLFGPLTTYEERGVLPRALEKIFFMAHAKKEEAEYHVVLSMFDVRKNKIKDLLTLGSYELKQVGDLGPKGLFYEEITSIEQGLGLILRGLMGQKLIPRASNGKYHTLVYLDIVYRSKPSLEEDDLKPPVEWRSRITFAKIAAMPQRDNPQPFYSPPQSPSDPFCLNNLGEITLAKIAAIEQERQLGFPFADPPFSDWYSVPALTAPEEPKVRTSAIERERTAVKNALQKNCCRGPNDKTAEGINIRKDMYFLEQMFIRAHSLRRILDYYSKLRSLGMYMIMRSPRLSPSQYFRQSRLSHCLKDIVSGQSEIRILLTVRPERTYIHSTLEAMRFAERARSVPQNLPKPPEPDKDSLTLEEQIAKVFNELGLPELITKESIAEMYKTYCKVAPEKMREVLHQATAYFENITLNHKEVPPITLEDPIQTTTLNKPNHLNTHHGSDPSDEDKDKRISANHITQSPDQAEKRISNEPASSADVGKRSLMNPSPSLVEVHDKFGSIAVSASNIHSQGTLPLINLESATSVEQISDRMRENMTMEERLEILSQHFDDLKYIAGKQAQALINAYPKRPPWSMY